MERRMYQSLSTVSEEDMKRILQKGTAEDFRILPLQIGESCTKWQQGQRDCLGLMEHQDALVRANAVLGLSYIARNLGVLDKRIVKPYILRELERNEEYRWKIIDAIRDINLFLGWKLAEKRIVENEKR